MSCEYSVPYPGTQSVFSSDGKLVSAVTAGNRLCVRNSDSLEVRSIFQCVDKIDKIEVSPDCCYILCALYSRNVIQVFSVEDKDWKCRINEGVAGMINAYWTPDSRNVVVESDFGIQVSIWSLTDSNSVIISLPKPPYTLYSKTGAFSDCGRFFALVHRIELQDQIGVYSVASQTSLGMSEISKFRARSNDVASIYWVPGGTHLITLDSPLTYKFCAYTPMGECLATYEAYQNALGVRSIALCRPPVAATPVSSTSMSSVAATNNVSSAGTGATAECKFIALGSFDGKVRLLSVYSWQVAFALPLLHPRELEAGFNSQGLLLTVEISVSGATRFGAGSAAEDEDESAATADVLAVEAADGAQIHVKQHQAPPARQVLRSVAYVPNRLQGVLLDRDGHVIQSNATEMEKTGQRLQHAAESERALQNMDSYFALRATKTLPRAQAFQLEGKRINTSTLLSTTRRTATAGGTTSIATSSSGHSSSSSYPAVGVSWVGWSCDNQLLAAREESHPRCLWVWRPLQAQLVALLVLLEPVTCARWRPSTLENNAQKNLPAAPRSPSSAPASSLPPVPPTGPAFSHAQQASADQSEEEETDVLAFCTGTPRVYFWTPASGVTYSDMSTLTSAETDSPADEGLVGASHGQNQGPGFPVTSLMWSKDGKSLLLRGKEAHCTCRVSLPLLAHQQRR